MLEYEFLASVHGAKLTEPYVDEENFEVDEDVAAKLDAISKKRFKNMVNNGRQREKSTNKD